MKDVTIWTCLSCYDCTFLCSWISNSWNYFLSIDTKVKERQKEKLEKFENEQRKIKSEKERKEKIVSFFEECQQRKIDETDEASIRIIAQKYGFLDSSKIMEFYSEAKQLFEEKKNEEEAKQKRRDREVQREKERQWALAFKDSIVKSKIVGTDKYINGHDEKIKMLEARAKLGVTISNYGSAMQSTTAQKQDWAIAGGIASGLAGAGAGVATALDVQRKNIEAEIEAKNIREQGRYISGLADSDVITSFSGDAKRELNYILHGIDAMKNKLVDTSATEDKFKYLDVTVTDNRVLSEYYMEFELKHSVDSDLKIVNSNAILDGSVKIVLSNDGEIIGEGVYCAPGFGELDISKIGFNVDKVGYVICKCNKNMYNTYNNLVYRVEPIKLWTIEK